MRGVLGGILPQSLNTELTDIGLILGTLMLCLAFVQILLRQIFKWMTIVIGGLIDKKLQVIQENMKNITHDRNTIIDILKDMRPAFEELLENGGTTIKDKVDQLYLKMLQEK